MSEIQLVSQENTEQSLTRFTVKDAKAIFHLINGKPDSMSQLLNGKKEIALANIIELNMRVQDKLVNHDYISDIVSVNLIFKDGSSNNYASWVEFLDSKLDIINDQTKAIVVSWDFLLKMPRYENPQRHTLTVKLGQVVSPKEFVELMFNSDNAQAISESRSSGVVRVDFINQVIANELLRIVKDWFDGLRLLPQAPFFQRFLEKYQPRFLSTVHTLTQIAIIIILMRVVLKLYEKRSMAGIMTGDLIIIATSALSIYLFSGLISRFTTSWMDRKIDQFKSTSYFILTNGDKLLMHDLANSNKSLSREIKLKLFVSLAASIILYCAVGFVSALLTFFGIEFTKN